MVLLRAVLVWLRAFSGSCKISSFTSCCSCGKVVWALVAPVETLARVRLDAGAAEMGALRLGGAAIFCCRAVPTCACCGAGGLDGGRLRRGQASGRGRLLPAGSGIAVLCLVDLAGTEKDGVERRVIWEAQERVSLPIV
ncbi:unnamed protein product [Phaeothamnion confervicola]